MRHNKQLTNQQGTKGAGKENIWPKMAKTAFYGSEMAVFGQNIKKWEGAELLVPSYISEKPLGTSFALAFRSGMTLNEPERILFGQK